ncbi:GH92 family glycosyl hydrolase [Microlunatus parietis]|uniref:Putative alpha-1,2-mannosidase n=1 Tax=Microlunatus parietis TaxID=682979 RepID=A0A7Y9IB89_9ACTN|nr:GH92 family glycosyl hydrolase [Microlunatus parietis]NYE73522.1 putative alpha-1,2-mannosidase [Microlunatus parietis]
MPASSPTTADLTLTPGTGPIAPPSSKPGAGLFAPTATGFETSTDGRARALVAEPDRVITAGDRLRYAIFSPYDPDAGTVEDGCAATAVGLELIMDDGTVIGGEGLVDDHGVPIDPLAQYADRTSFPDQWNHKSVDLTALAGRRVAGIALLVDVSGLPTPGRRTVRGWFELIGIGPAEPGAEGRRPADFVRTTRGTHASGGYSRGNNAPLTAVPHGFHFVTPITDARTFRWIYSWHQHNNADNRPELQGLALSHIPSPWIGDRTTFQVCPWGSADRPELDPAARGLEFDHADETDRAHYYCVTTRSGIRAEVAPTDHAVIMRFTFSGPDAALIFDQSDDHGGLRLATDPETGRGIVTGYADGGSQRAGATPRMFVYGELDAPVVDHGPLDQPDHTGVGGYLRVRPGADATVVLRLASSFIGLDQAKRNLAAELGPDQTVESVAERAEQTWNELLGKITVGGATEDQLITVYSNLYRLFLYPNTMSENVGTEDAPRPAYASPFRVDGPDTEEHTGRAVLDGECSANNGFWDTYRTCWTALGLFEPERTGRLLDGFVQHYRDGGWTARWSAPGYADCMVGTSSDIVLADAYVNGVPGFDVADGYDSALRNATVPADEPVVGRYGLEKSIFAGYTSTAIDEGLSWTLEGAINDYGLAVWSAALAERAAADDPRREEYRANARYFASRAAWYVNLFDERTGFFVGRDDHGAFRVGPDGYDPRQWGGDYTETNGWGMAFTVPQDGAGLAALHGGQDQLRERLDAFFATDETGAEGVKGAYGHVIHEMTEARNIRLGMLALSNQPAHHIPYFYLHAGASERTQQLVRECVRRLFVGSEIGQGYPGDEDNGEMSAWYLFSAFGLYPLSLASGELVLTAPTFAEVRIELDQDRELVIIAHDQHPDHHYIQSVLIDGEPWTSVAVPYRKVADGATIEFFLGPEPSDWGADSAPASLTPAGERPRPLVDLTRPDGPVAASTGDGAAAVDDTSATAITLPPGGWVEYTLEDPAVFELYTITASPGEMSGWVLEGSDDGETWQPIDERTGEEFGWQRQTRPFRPGRPGAHRRVRLRVADDHPSTLQQWELLV